MRAVFNIDFFSNLGLVTFIRINKLTFHILFEILLGPVGIHTTRESNEGIGNVDFKFMFTTSNQVPLKVLSELKLAHNQKSKHGLTSQLPAYLMSDRAKFGIFIVMWFKDEKNEFFKKPKYDKSEFISCLENESEIINKNKEFFIKPVPTMILDCS
ncbi:MAG: hypothetical protein PHN79_10515 [Methanoregula sp.]|nr:hypothetical protein [Methanoregula sp.]